MKACFARISMLKVIVLEVLVVVVVVTFSLAKMGPKVTAGLATKVVSVVTLAET